MRHGGPGLMYWRGGLATGLPAWRRRGGIYRGVGGLAGVRVRDEGAPAPAGTWPGGLGSERFGPGMFVWWPRSRGGGAGPPRSAAVAGGLVWPVVAGVVLIVAGIDLRAWLIPTLGRFFQYLITVQPGHRVVTGESVRRNAGSDGLSPVNGRPLHLTRARGRGGVAGLRRCDAGRPRALPGAGHHRLPAGWAAALLRW